MVAAAAAAAEAAEECAQGAARAVEAVGPLVVAAAGTGRRPDVRPPCRAQVRDPLRGHLPAGLVRDQAAASDPAVRIARRWATCRRQARGRVPRVLELDLALAADRVTSPIVPAARDLVPVVVRVASPAAARGLAPADVLAAVDHLPAISETSSIWVGPVAVAPVFDQARRRPAARSQAARRLRSCKTTPADSVPVRVRKVADAPEAAILP